MVVNGMILAAGFGSRLLPLTVAQPKALVPAGGRAMIDWAIHSLRRAGCRRIVVNAHHHADAMESHLLGTDFGVEIVLLREQEILGTGGGILNARDVLDGGGPFLVHNADIISDFDCTRLIDEQSRSGALAILAVNQRPTSRPLRFNDDMIFLGKDVWREDGLEIPDASPSYGFCGIHLISPALFECGVHPGFSDIFDVYRHAMHAGAFLRGHCFAGSWHDLGSLDRIRAFEESRKR